MHIITMSMILQYTMLGDTLFIAQCTWARSTRGRRYYNWFIVTNVQKKRHSFAVPNSLIFLTFRRQCRPRQPRMALARGNTLLSKKRNYSAATSDNCFDFSQNDDDCKELAKGFQPKSTKLSNSQALNLYIAKWDKAHREHVDESILTNMSLLTQNRDPLW